MSDLKLAFIQVETGRARPPIPVLFNPSEYTIEKGNTYQSTTLPGLATPVSQFVAGNADTLSMELFFDTYSPSLRKNFVTARQDVRDFTRPLAELLDMDSTIHAPPVVSFIWGPPIGGPGRIEFKAIIEKLTQRFTMFLDDGTPVRAVVNVTFKEYKTIKDQLAEIARESADHTKLRTLKEGDSLWFLAAENYGDAEEWRVIAKENEIENPRILTPGVRIEIPPLE
jgi:hypothetical protein